MLNTTKQILNYLVEQKFNRIINKNAPRIPQEEKIVNEWYLNIYILNDNWVTFTYCF